MMGGLLPRTFRRESVSHPPGVADVFGDCVPWALLLLLVFSSLHSTTAGAQGTLFSDTRTDRTQVSTVDIGETSHEEWGLEESDWSRYVELRAGPAGLWYSHVSPAMVLGIFARTDTERRRYARLVYDQEQARLQALFDFNRAYLEVARSEQENPEFRIFRDGPGIANLPSSSNPAGRMLLFVGLDCPECDRISRRLIRSEQPLDIYFVGAESDLAIRQWASRMDIPGDRVHRQEITLNHAGAGLLRAGFSGTPLPLLFRDPALETPLDLNRYR